jgi:hypothetical protein
MAETRSARASIERELNILWSAVVEKQFGKLQSPIDGKREVRSSKKENEIVVVCAVERENADDFW